MHLSLFLGQDCIFKALILKVRRQWIQLGKKTRELQAVWVVVEVQVGGPGAASRTAWVVRDRGELQVCLKETDGICLVAP